MPIRCHRTSYIDFIMSVDEMTAHEFVWLDCFLGVVSPHHLCKILRASFLLIFTDFPCLLVDNLVSFHEILAQKQFSQFQLL